MTDNYNAFDEIDFLEVDDNEQQTQHLNAGRGISGQITPQTEPPPVEPTNNDHSNNASPKTSKTTKQSQQWRITTLASSIAAQTSKGAVALSQMSADRLSLEGQLKQARISLQKYLHPKILTAAIPKYILRGAKGIVFLTIVKAGFLFAGNVGTGIVIVRNSKKKDKKKKKNKNKNAGKTTNKKHKTLRSSSSANNSYSSKIQTQDFIRFPDNANDHDHDHDNDTIDDIIHNVEEDDDAEQQNLMNMYSHNDSNHHNNKNNNSHNTNHHNNHNNNNNNNNGYITNEDFNSHKIEINQQTWSGPSSIGVAGVSFGFLAGASKVDYIMILPNAWAVKQFTGHGQLRLGGELQLAVGPMGRDANASVGGGDKGISVMYSYSHAKGLYGGLSLDGKIISVRPECNRTFYGGQKVSASDILKNRVQPPKNDDYDLIIHMLNNYCRSEHAFDDEKEVDLLHSHSTKRQSIDLTDVTPLFDPNAEMHIPEDIFVSVRCKHIHESHPSANHNNNNNNDESDAKADNDQHSSEGPSTLTITITHLSIHDTLMDIKMRIAKQRNILNWKQIELRNESMDLLWQDFRTLKELHIEEADTVLFYNDCMQIMVKTPLNKTLKLLCKSNDTIKDIKLQIQSKENILTELQQLMFHSKPLIDDKATLTEYGVFHDSTLYVRWNSTFVNTQTMQNQAVHNMESQN